MIALKRIKYFNWFVTIFQTVRVSDINIYYGKRICIGE